MLRRVDWAVVTDTVEESKSFIFTVSQSDKGPIPKDCGESSTTVREESQISQHAAWFFDPVGHFVPESSSFKKKTSRR
jgi:hypothetical protein